MTDEEIEIELKECYEKFWEKSAQQPFFKDALDYINRLKIRVQELGACNIRILEREAGQIRKDTAKEILQHLFNFVQAGTKDDSNDFAHACNEIKYKIRVESRRYGVEVDDE